MEMPFRLRVHAGLRNHVLHGVQIAACQGAIFRGKDMHGHAQWHSAVSCAKWLNQLRCCLLCGLGLAQESTLNMGVHIGATWRIPMNRPCAAAMRSFCQITLTTCLIYISSQNTLPATRKKSTFKSSTNDFVKIAKQQKQTANHIKLAIMGLHLQHYLYDFSTLTMRPIRLILLLAPSCFACSSASLYLASLCWRASITEPAFSGALNSFCLSVKQKHVWYTSK